MSIQFRNKLRFHILGIPHTITGPEWSVCPFTTKVWKFAKMMKERGHYIVHYGHEDSNVACDEHVTLITNTDFKNAYGDYNWREKGLYYYQNNNDLCHIKFNRLAIPEIKKRLEMGDYVLCFWGKGHEEVGKTLHKDERAIVIEPGVGYSLDQTFAHFKIFESYASFHQFLGKTNNDPSWYNAVVPLVSDINQFCVKSQRKEYFLHLGRIDKCKGLDIVVQACNYLNVKLKVAGTPIDGLEKLNVTLGDNIEYIGCVGIEERRELLSNAKAFMQLSTYAEPFGCAVVEAMLSGCPVITSDWGGFSETVLHGKTGYRVRNFDQLIWAMQNIDNIDGNICRLWAEKNYSDEKIAPMFEEYFYSLRLNLFGDNKWWTINNDNRRTELEWLSKDYSMFSTNSYHIPDLSNKILENQIIEKHIPITLVITTCKRLLCFINLFDSLYENCNDFNTINEIYLIDDSSTIKDRLKMTQYLDKKLVGHDIKYKLIPRDKIKGQIESFNIIFNSLSINNNYILLLEDDWIFTKTFTINNIVKHMNSDKEISQIQLCGLFKNLQYYNYNHSNLYYYKFNISSPEIPKDSRIFLKKNNLWDKLINLCKDKKYGYTNNISNDYWWPGFRFNPSFINYNNFKSIMNNKLSITHSEYFELELSSKLALDNIKILHTDIGIKNDTSHLSAFILNMIPRSYEDSDPTIITAIYENKDFCKQYEGLSFICDVQNPIIIYTPKKYLGDLEKLYLINRRIIFREITESYKKIFKYNHLNKDINSIFLNYYWLLKESKTNYFNSKEFYWVSSNYNINSNFNNIKSNKFNIYCNKSIDYNNKLDSIKKYTKIRNKYWFSADCIGGNYKNIHYLILEYFRYAKKMIEYDNCIPKFNKF